MRKFFLGLAILSATTLFVGCLPAEDVAGDEEVPAEAEVVVEPEAEVVVEPEAEAEADAEADADADADAEAVE